MADADTDIGLPDESLLDVAREVSAAGGRALIVGGWVRDRLRGEPSKDADVEVFGLALDRLEAILGSHGEVITIGRSFGVLRVKGIDVDFSLPRRDSKVAAGHRGFIVNTDPGLDFATASLRRDLTVNSIGYDPLTGEILDPHGGRADLARRVLRATAPDRFPEDPLRGLRVAQFAARLEMEPDRDLIRLCRALDLSELSPERILGEFRKLLGKGRRPSRGLEILRQTGQIRFFPELEALIDTPQDPEWHPEGDVWVHTLMVIDEAAALRRDDEADEPLMFGALCHDLGKPVTTVVERGRIRSPAHDARGVQVAERFLARLRAPARLVAQVGALVKAHLAPMMFIKNGATARGYRRLARQLAAADVSVELLERVARADHLGRTTPDALARTFAEGDRFLDRARELLVESESPPDVVRGRDLLARGMRPGKAMGETLARCREIQDETGWTDVERILERVLPNRSDGSGNGDA